MNVLDVFKGNAFNLVALTDAINLMPFKPSRIGAMGLFEEQGVTQRVVIIEERDGVLMLIPRAPYGAPAPVSLKRVRRARNFEVIHLPLDDTVSAAEVQGIRAFGSQSEVEGVVQVVNDKIAVMRQSHEMTLEWHRMGAVKGIVYDADASTVLHDLYAEFGVHKTPDMDWDIHTGATDQKQNCLDAKRLIEDALGAAPYDHVHALCGDNWFDMFVNHALVKTAYERWSGQVAAALAIAGSGAGVSSGPGAPGVGAFLRDDQRRGFPFAGVIFENYRGKIVTPGRTTTTTTKFIDDEEMRLFPVGVPGLFKTYFGPADFIETINTVGRPYYAKQQLMDMDRGVNLHTQSNPLCLCTRPRVLIRGYGTS